MSYTPPSNEGPAQPQAPSPFGGQNAPYIPPPPPPSRKSPWLFVGLGCGLLALLTFGGCIAVFKTMGDKIVADQKMPLDKKAVIAGLGDIPQYPGSQLSETMTKIERSAFSFMKILMKGNDPQVGAFESKDDIDKVTEWYDKAMDKAGWEPSNSVKMPNMGNGATNQKQYRKGADAAVVQVQHNTKGDTKFPTLIVVIRMPNIKE